MSIEQSWVDEEFPRIVEANHFQEDILVPVLADNLLLRHTLTYLPFLATEADQEDSKTELEKFLMGWYGLRAELCEDVFDRCEDNLKFHEECETWGEPHG